MKNEKKEEIVKIWLKIPIYITALRGKKFFHLLTHLKSYLIKKFFNDIMIDRAPFSHDKSYITIV